MTTTTHTVDQILEDGTTRTITVVDDDPAPDPLAEAIVTALSSLTSSSTAAQTRTALLALKAAVADMT